MPRYLDDIMRIRKLLVRKEFALALIESAILYCPSTTKKPFVKVVKEKDTFSVLLAGAGMRLSLGRRCLYEIARCA